MRKYIYRLVLLSLYLCCCGGSFAAVLTGSYTIDASLPASGTNFKDFTSAVAYLTGVGTRTDGGADNTAPFGISGNVVFRVAAGTYTERVVISGTISGASDTSTVTFDGGNGNAATRILTYAAATSATRHTLEVTGSRYLRFRNLSVQTSGSNWGWAVHLTGAGVGNIHIKNCLIELTGAATTSTGSGFCGIVINGSATSLSSGMRADSLQIDSNTVNYGYYGIFHSGLAADLSVGNTFRWNKVRSFMFGISITYNNDFTIRANDVRMHTNLDNPIAIRAASCGSNWAHTTNFITENRITGPVTGLFVSYSVNSQAKGLIANNIVNGVHHMGRGIQLVNNSNWMVYNNTVKMTNALSSAETFAGIYLENGSGISLVNNVIAEVTEGRAVPVYSSFAVVDTMDYNHLYSKDGKLMYKDGSFYNTGTIIGGAGLNQHSITVLPLFVNDSSAYTRSRCNTGMALPNVVDDIDGITRGLPPLIGATEDTAAAPLNDLSVIRISAPGSPVAAGYHDVAVQVRNNGSNPVTSGTVSYQLNSGAVISQPLSFTIAPCDTITVIFNGPGAANITGNVNTIVAYTEAPNAAADADLRNDTLRKAVYIPLSGTYRIGNGAATDFKTFGEAASALKEAGVSGAVEFLVDSGIYTERVVLDEAIAGASDVNTITFDGGAGQAATRIVTFNSLQSGERNTIQVGASHVRFRNLTVKSQNATYGFPFQLSAELSDVHIKNCVIDASSTTGTTSGEVAGIAVSYNRVGNGPYDGLRADRLELDSNTITGGYIGIAFMGVSGNNSLQNKIRRNTITGQYYQGIMMQNQTGASIGFNTIVLATGADRAIELSYSSGDSLMPQTVQGNRISNAGTGIYLRSNNAANGRGKLINNVIAASGFTMWCASGPTNWDIDHNTFINPLGETVIYNTSASGLRIRNNIFASQNPNGNSSMMNFGGTALLAFDHNIFYQANQDTGVGLFTIQGTTYTRSNYKGARGFNLNSYAENPVFVNDTSDYRLTSGCFTAASIGIATDVLDSVRAIPADIGAYEFAGVSNDLAVEAILTRFDYPVSPGTADLQVRLRNTGNTSISSASVHYQVNDSAIVSMTWGGFLLPCDTASVTFTGAQALQVGPLLSRIKIFTDLPNGLPDGSTLNDTLKQTISTTLKGTYTVGGASPDFGNLADVSSALRYGGISGAVTFNIRTGTYTDAIVLERVLGADSSITFRSEAGHTDSVIVTYSATGVNTDNRVVKLNTQNVHFDRLTFRATGAGLCGRVFEIGYAPSSSITNCRLIGKPATSFNGLNADAYTIVAGYGNNVRNMTIANNRFENGSSGLSLPVLNVSTGVSVTGNRFENQYGFGAHLAYFRGLNFSHNTIVTNSASRVYCGAALVYCGLRTQVTYNRINIANGGIGMLVTNFNLDTTIADPALVTNNVISLHTEGLEEPYVRTTIPMTFSSGLIADYNKNVQFLHNSIQLTGTSLNTTCGAVLQGNYEDVVFQNNIVANKAGSSAVTLDNTGNVKSDYNNYYSNSAAEYAYVMAPGTIGAPGSVFAVSGLSGLHQYVFTDSSSVAYRPAFTSDSTLVPDANDSSAWALNGRGIHHDALLAGTDRAGNIRAATRQQGIPDLGAYELTPLSTPPQAAASGYLMPDSITAYLSVFAPNDTIVRMKWDAASAVPGELRVRQYVGEKPPAIDTASSYMYYYVSIEPVVPAPSTPLYRIGLRYKDHWLGTVADEGDMRLANYAGSWVNAYLPSSFTSAVLNRLYDTTITENVLNIFTGTDAGNPLPVVLLSFAGRANRTDAVLTWNTASEHNSKGFEVQRSADGKTFEAIGFVASAGRAHAYAYTDKQAFASAPVQYYRLRQLDLDGSKAAFSRTITLSSGQRVNNLSVYPNPFRSSVNVVLDAIPAGNVDVVICNLYGQVVSRVAAPGSTGAVAVNNLEALAPGVYLIKVTVSGETHITKLVKE